MVNPINLSGSILEVLRRQMLRRKTASGAADAESTSEAGNEPQLVEIVAQQKQAQAYLRSIDPQDPAYFRKARKLFLQLVLADAFGDAKANDAAFAELVKAVENLLDEEPELNQAFDELFQRLREGKS